MKTRLRQTYQHTVLTTYIRHEYNITAAHEKRIFFLHLVNQKSLSHIIRTLKKKKLVLLLIPNQATLYNNKKQQHTSSCYAQYTVYLQGKTNEKIIPHLTRISESKCFKKFQTIQLLVIKYKSYIHKISQIRQFTKSYV